MGLRRRFKRDESGIVFYNLMTAPIRERHMSRRKQIYEGKAKILYEGPEPGTLVQYFKDDATAFNAEKKAILDGKGVLNNRISEFVMLRLADIGIPTPPRY